MMKDAEETVEKIRTEIIAIYREVRERIQLSKMINMKLLSVIKMAMTFPINAMHEKFL